MMASIMMPQTLRRVQKMDILMPRRAIFSVVKREEKESTGRQSVGGGSADANRKQSLRMCVEY